MLTFHPISDTATPEFAHVWQLYEEAFPPEERRTAAQHLEVLANPAYSFRAILMEQKVCGVMGVWQLPGFLFLEHFAIDPIRRREGIGSFTLQLFLRAALQPVLLEVEPPLDDLKQSRIAFYERAGFQLNPFVYQQPPYSSGKPWVPLYLMTYPELLTPETFDWVKAQLYREVYGQ